MTALAYDATNHIVYAGAATGGLWKTTDGGNNWTPLTDNQPSLAVGTITLDPANPKIIYVGTGEANFAARFGYSDYYGVGILKSVNGGQTWTLLGQNIFANHSGGSVSYISKILVDPNSPTDNRRLVVGTTNGLFLSTDGGSNFSTVLSSGTGNAAITDMIIDSSTNPSTVTAAWGFPFGDPGNGIYRSTDGGANFARFGSGLPATNRLGRIALAQAPSSPQQFYAVISDAATSGSLGMFGSNNKGANWTQVTAATSNGGPDLLGDDQGIIEQGWYCNSVVVDPANAAIVYVGGLNVFKTTNGGGTFQDLTKSYTSQTFTPKHHQHALVMTGPNNIYIGNNGGVYSSSNGGANWTDSNGNIAITQFYGGSTTANFNSNQVIYAGSQDNGTQKYSGNPVWFETKGSTYGIGGFTATDPNNSNVAYSTDTYLNLSKTTNGGSTWNDSQSGINPQGSDHLLYVSPFVMDKSNSSHMVAGTNYVYQTTNGAASWQRISPLLVTSASDNSKAISALAIAPNSGNTIYAGTSDGKVWVTTNGGGNWQDISAGTAGRFVKSFGINPTNSQDVIITFSGFAELSGATQGTHVYRSVDAGGHWTDLSTNLPNTPVNSVLRNPGDPNTFYLGTDVGFFFTTNNAGEWTQYQVGLPNVVINQLFTDGNSSTLFAATHGRRDVQLAVVGFW